MTFAIEGPAYVSFSGGRTSAYMLRRVLDAHGGRLPTDIHVVFANTGDEMPGTLDFVDRVAREWSVPIEWVEYALTEDDRPTYRRVTYETADRNGGPFDAYIDHVARMCADKGEPPYLPGPGNRYCTTELKIRVMKRLMLDLGYEYWTNVVGMRHDEPKRWRKIDRSCPKERWEIALPLVDAKIDVLDVRGFWQEQPFDLQLAGDWEGNCDGCILKMPWKVARVFRDHPERAPKWLAREARTGKLFRGTRGPSYAQLFEASKQVIVEESDEFEIKCGACTD